MQRTALLVAIALVIAYSFFSQSLGVTLTAIGVGAIAYALSKSLVASLVVLALVVLMKDANRMMGANRMMTPRPVEAFQAQDPVTVQQRIEDVKVTAPKVQVITGVLESPSILNSTPLQGVQELANEGVPGSSIPASAKARVLIYPPAENTIPAPSESMFMSPKENPYLQTGQDRLAEEVAHAQKGTELYAEDSASLNGVAGGAGPAF
jgi:hypothetical protein